MCHCWNEEPTARPTFDQLVAWIDDVLSRARPGGCRADGSQLYQNVTRRPSASLDVPGHLQPTRCQPATAAAAAAPGAADDEMTA